jgi:hypothetical protein
MTQIGIMLALVWHNGARVLKETGFRIKENE